MIVGKIKLEGRGLYKDAYAMPADELADKLNDCFGNDFNFELQSENEISFEVVTVANAEDILEMVLDYNRVPEEIQEYMDNQEIGFDSVRFAREEL